MSAIDATAGTIDLKVVVCGASGVGKLTNLRAMARLRDPDAAPDPDDTVIFPLPAIGRYAVHLHFSIAPNGAFYDGQRKQALRGVDGIVFVTSSQEAHLEHDHAALDELRSHLAEMGSSFDATPHVFQYNKRDLPGAMPVASLREAVDRVGHPAWRRWLPRETGSSTR